MLKKLQQSIEIDSLKPDLHLATTIRLQPLYRQSVCLTGLIECTGQINLTAIASRSQTVNCSTFRSTRLSFSTNL
ncbi:MAG: hypothetical protein CM15mP74_02210 [Halieaceae bacterium]|nr:MAG: hypothetical protein CM15mP74_02210 [Halieaceae bacterium]